MDRDITFAQWREDQVERFVCLAIDTPKEYRVHYLRMHAKTLVEDTLRFGRDGLEDDSFMPTE